MSQPSSTRQELHPANPPVVPLPQDPFIPRRRLQALVNLFPAGQFTRYILVGAFNTLFGYATSRLNNTTLNASPCERVEGLDQIDRVIDIDQSDAEIGAG